MLQSRNIMYFLVKHGVKHVQYNQNRNDKLHFYFLILSIDEKQFVLSFFFPKNKILINYTKFEREKNVCICGKKMTFPFLNNVTKVSIRIYKPSSIRSGHFSDLIGIEKGEFI